MDKGYHIIPKQVKIDYFITSKIKWIYILKSYTFIKRVEDIKNVKENNYHNMSEKTKKKKI